MSEGRTYQCGWEQTAEGWRIWVCSRPELEARAGSLEEAEWGLAERVCGAVGDGEPIFVYVPPLPASEADAPYLARGLALLQNRAYGWIKGQPRDYLLGEPCHICRYLPGPRNDRPLEESSPPEGDLCHRNQLRFGPVMATERFVALLSDAERACLELRPITRPPRARKQMFELIPRIILPQVAIIGGTPGGWRCRACGMSCFDSPVRGGEVHRLVSDEALGCTPPAIFGVGDAADCTLAMPMERAVALSGHPHARGAAAVQLGTAPRGAIDPEPVLPEFDPAWA